MVYYVGLVPYPNPESQGFELRDNVPFKAKLTILRRGTRMKDRTSALAADSDGRCFRIFRKEFSRLQLAFGKLTVGSRISGKWIFVRKGISFGLVLLAYRNFRGTYAPVPVEGRAIDPYQLTGVRS